jgi:hypothetical protein
MFDCLSSLDCPCLIVSAVLVTDKSAYIREAERQLSDDRFYSKSDKDPTKQFSDEITNELNNMYDYGYIDEKALKYLIPDSPKPGRFYLLPKIHKANNPGRPIDSLLTVIPLKKSQNLWISTFANMLKLFHLLSKIPLIVSIVTKHSVGGILTERDSQISLQASMPSE